MRVLVAGATSVPGIPLLRELNSRGHEVIGLTRSSSKTSQIEAAGAKPVVADVFDADEIDKVVADIGPEVVVSLLTTLPKWGPKRPKDFEPATEAVGHGAPEPRRRRAARRRAARRRRVGGLRLRLPDVGPGADGRDRSVSRAAAARRGRDARRAAGHGADSADVRRAQRHRGNRVALRRLLRTGSAARRVVHPTGEVVGVARHDRRRNRLLGAHRRRREGDGRCARQRPGRADLQHRRRPAAVVRRLCARAVREAAPAAADADFASAGRAGRLLPGGARSATTWLPLSNAKAKAELGWTPIPR